MLNLKKEFPLAINKRSIRVWDVSTENLYGCVHSAQLNIVAYFRCVGETSLSAEVNGPGITRIARSIGSSSGTLSLVSPYTSGTIFAQVTSVSYAYEEIQSCTVSGEFALVQIRDLACTQNNALYPITISWAATNQNLFELTVRQNGAVKYTKQGTTERLVTIPEGVLSGGDVSVTLESGNGTCVGGYGVSTTTSETFSVVDPRPIVSDLRPDQDEQNGGSTIRVSWQANYQTAYTLKAYWGNTLVTTVTGATERSVVLPANLFFDGAVKLELTVTNTLGSSVHHRTVSSTFPVVGRPTIAVHNILPGDAQNGANTIRVSWESSNQEAYELKVFWGSVLAKTYTGTTEKFVVLPARMIFDGMARLELTVRGSAYGVTYSKTGESTFQVTGNPVISLKNLTPNASQSGTSEMQIAWESENQQIYSLKVYWEGILAKTYSGTTEKSVLLPSNFLFDGTAKLDLVVSSAAYGAQYSASASNAVRIYNNPALMIQSLEPNNIAQNNAYPITLVWISVGQERYQLTVKNNGQEKGRFSGAVDKMVRLPELFLAAGTAEHTLTVYRTIFGHELSLTKTASCIVYGNPQPPELDSKTNYSEAKPRFFWSTDQQSGYHVQILTQTGDIVDDSQPQNGEVFGYTTTTVLVNHGEYTLRVRVKNSYQMWSDWAQKRVYVSYTELTPASVSAVGNNAKGTIFVDIANPYSDLYDRFELYRSEGGLLWRLLLKEKTRNTTYVDQYVGSGINYSYKVISYSTDGGAAESAVVTARVQFEAGSLSVVGETALEVMIPYEHDTQISHIDDHALMQFLGRSAPTMEVGPLIYETLQLQIDMEMGEYYKLRSLKQHSPLLYKNSRGAVLFCAMTSLSAQYIKNVANWVRVQAELTEIHHTVTALSSGIGQQMVPTYADGTWYANGEIDASGWAMVEE